MSALPEGIELHHPELQQQMEFLNGVHAKAFAGSMRDAATLLATSVDGAPSKWGSEKDARKFLHNYWKGLLDSDQYWLATALTWEREVFDARPFHVWRMFECLRDHDLVILLGSSGMSKTFGVAVWAVLDFQRDPSDTSVRFGSVDEKNLRGNLWANISFLSQNALFRPEGLECNSSTMVVSMPEMREECGMEAVMLPKSNNSTGKVKGYHPRNFRPYSHPIWGRSTRCRLIIDEAQNTYDGVPQDFGSPKMSVDAATHVMKIIVTCNPESETKWVVKMARPENGYTAAAMETEYDWTSPEGWRVCRLDARRHENIIYRRRIFPNQVTSEALSGLMSNGMQVTRQTYIFGFGWPPPGNVADVAVPTDWFDRSIGTPIFTGKVTGAAGLDVADTGDKTVLALCRYGTARGWVDAKGEEHLFDSRKIEGEFELRHCFVVDQLIHTSAKDAASSAAEVRAWCERQQIRPEFLVVDKTGMGVGPCNILQRTWSSAVIGINFSAGPTTRKVLAEDKEGADFQASDIASEMYLTVRNWIDPQVAGLFINPTCANRDALKLGLTGRHKKTDSVDRFLIEEKKLFISRNRVSPDEADAVGMATMAIRVNNMQLPAMTDEAPISLDKDGGSGGAVNCADETTYQRHAQIGGGKWVNPSMPGLSNGGSVTITIPSGFFR